MKRLCNHAGYNDLGHEGYNQTNIGLKHSGLSVVIIPGTLGYNQTNIGLKLISNIFFMFFSLA